MSEAHFMALWAQAQPAVSNYLAAVCPDRLVCEEILQDTAVTCFQRFASYDHDRPFVPWAVGVARLSLKDHRRKAGRSRLHLADDVEALLGDQLSAQDRSEHGARTEALRECVSLLDGRARAVLELRYADSLPLTAVAERVGSTHGAVRALVCRLHRKLHDCIMARLGRSGEDV